LSALPSSSSFAALQVRFGPRYRWLLLVAVMVGTMASIMSFTIINVAIPDMSQHFSLGQGRVQWVSSGFMVAMTISMLTTPWLLARYGYRYAYVGTMLLLMAGGIVGGLANNFGLVLGARVAEGLADLFGWRSIFFMVIPLCLLSLWMAYRYVPDAAPSGVSADRNGEMIDWRGLLLAAAGTLCLLNGMVALHAQGNNLVEAAILLGAALATLAAFIGWQRRMADTRREPLMNLALFGYWQFAMGSVVAFIYGTALFGLTYLLPCFYPQVFLLSQ
jgi:MFS family permease